MQPTPRRRARSLALAALTLALLGAWRLRDRGTSATDDACPTAEETCPEGGAPARAGPAAPTVHAADVCPDAGYLCAELANSDRVGVRRWKRIEGPLVIHVPRPDFEDAGVAMEFQRAATLGIRAWNNQPFPILVDTRGDRQAHFEVVWRTALSGTQIGVARTRWSPDEGLTVLSIELTTRDPYRPGTVSDPQKVRLTAAHEMGHALGLPHSDAQRDVMYPTNTATSVSARDRRTMEALYALEDGTQIVR